MQTGLPLLAHPISEESAVHTVFSRALYIYHHKLCYIPCNARVPVAPVLTSVGHSSRVMAALA